MATRQQLDRMEEAQKALAQQQQFRIQVRAAYFVHHNLQETQASSPAPEPSEHSPRTVSERHINIPQLASCSPAEDHPEPSCSTALLLQLTLWMTC